MRDPGFVVIFWGQSFVQVNPLPKLNIDFYIIVPTADRKLPFYLNILAL